MQVYQRASAQIAKRNGEGIKCSANSFSILSDNEIMDRALELGIDISRMPLETVYLVKNLEDARANMQKKKEEILTKSVVDGKDKTGKEVEQHDNGEIHIDVSHPQCDSQNSMDENRGSEDDGEEEFTPVMSKKSRKSEKNMVRIFLFKGHPRWCKNS